MKSGTTKTATAALTRSAGQMGRIAAPAAIAGGFAAAHAVIMKRFMWTSLTAVALAISGQAH